MAFIDFLSGGISTGLELFTKKQQVTQTFQETTTIAPTITRNIDFQFITATEGSSVDTKKEQTVSQTPSIQQIPSISIIPTQGDIGIPKVGGGSDTGIGDILIIGALVIGAVFLLPKILPTGILKSKVSKK